MTSPYKPAAFYRSEADRVRRMARSRLFRSVADSLLMIADQYDVLAAQTYGLQHHRFGVPFRSRGVRRRA